MNVAIILLSGSGTRIGGEVPKQFVLKRNKPLYLYCVDTFHKCRKIDGILLVTSKENILRVKDDVSNEKYKKIIDVIEGGEKRYNSSYNGVKYLYHKYKNFSQINVLIHDGVRCNVSKTIISRNLKALKKYNAILTAIKGEEQKERVDTFHCYEGIDYLAQTPQSFNLELIYGLYNLYFASKEEDITDEIRLCELNKCHYVVVKGSKDNYKITYKQDLERFLRK